MFDSTYRILNLVSFVERIRGRKKLQKMVYLLSVAGTKFHYKYKYHHFGPYSAELQTEINDLVDQQLLHENHEEQAYVYELTEKGKLFLKRLEEQYRYNDELDRQLAEQLAKQNSQFLEMMSTYTFLLRSGDDPDEARVKAAELKQHLQDTLDDAVRYVHTKIIS